MKLNFNKIAFCNSVFMIYTFDLMFLFIISLNKDRVVNQSSKLINRMLTIYFDQKGFGWEITPEAINLLSLQHCIIRDSKRKNIYVEIVFHDNPFSISRNYYFAGNKPIGGPEIRS